MKFFVGYTSREACRKDGGIQTENRCGWFPFILPGPEAAFAFRCVKTDHEKACFFSLVMIYLSLFRRHGGMADAPHSKCGGKPCRFKSDCRYHVSADLRICFFCCGISVFCSPPHFRLRYLLRKCYENGNLVWRKQFISLENSPHFLVI